MTKNYIYLKCTLYLRKNLIYKMLHKPHWKKTDSSVKQIFFQIQQIALLLPPLQYKKIILALSFVLGFCGATIQAQNCTVPVIPKVLDISEVNPGSGDGIVRLTYDIDCGNRSGQSACPTGDENSIYHYVGFYGQNSPAPNGSYLEYGVLPVNPCENPAGDVVFMDMVVGGQWETPYCSDYKKSTCGDYELGQLISDENHTWSVDEWCTVNPTYDFILCPGQCYNVFMWEFVVDSPNRTGCRSDNGNVTSNCSLYTGISCDIDGVSMVAESPVSEVYRICLSGVNEPIDNPILTVNIGDGSQVCPSLPVTYVGNYSLLPEDEGDIDNSCVSQDIDCEDDNFNSNCGTQVGTETNDDDILITFVGSGGNSANGQLAFGNGIETGGDGSTHHVVEINCRENLKIDFGAPLACQGEIDLTENGIPICDDSPATSTNAIVYVSNNGVPIVAANFQYNDDSKYECIVDGTSIIGDPGENGTLQCGITDATGYPNNYTAQFGNFLNVEDDCSFALIGNPFEGAGVNPFTLPGTETINFGDGILRQSSVICVRYEDPCDGSKSSTCIRFLSSGPPITASMRNCNIICEGDQNGQLIIENLVGGTPDPNGDGDYSDGNGLPYSFNIDGPTNTTFTNIPGTTRWETAENLPAGNYVVTISDPEGIECNTACSAIVAATVDEPTPALTPVIEVDPDCGLPPFVRVSALYGRDTTFSSNFVTPPLLDGSNNSSTLLCDGSSPHQTAPACDGAGLADSRNAYSIEVSNIFQNCPEQQVFNAGTELTVCFEFKNNGNDKHNALRVFLLPPCTPGDSGTQGGVLFSGTAFGGAGIAGGGPNSVASMPGEVCFTTVGGIPGAVTAPGTYQNQGAMSAMYGSPMNGTWSLYIINNEVFTGGAPDCSGNNFDELLDFSITFGNVNCGENIRTFCSGPGPGLGTGEGVNAPNLGIADPTDLAWTSTDDPSLQYLIIANPGNGSTEAFFDDESATNNGIAENTQICYTVTGYLPGGRFENSTNSDNEVLSPNCYDGTCCEVSREVCFNVTNCVFDCPAQVVEIDVVDAACNAENGSMNVTVSGGTTPYTYNWSNGANTPNIDGLGAGTYTITITDANSCVITSQAEIIQPNQPIVSASVIPVCAGQDVNLTSNVTGGISPYTYLWSGPSGYSSTDPNPVIASASAQEGIYILTLTDAGGCTITSEIEVNLSNLNIEVNQINPNCNGTLGDIDIVVNGGVEPYTYSWSDENGKLPLITEPCEGQLVDIDFQQIEEQQPPETAINDAAYTVQGATLSVGPPILNGAGTAIDENNIENIQLSTKYALRTGYSQIIQGGVNGANVSRTWTFSDTVCGVTIFINDIDRNDEVIVNATLQGGAPLDLTSAFTIADPPNTCVAYTATNTWSSICPPPASNLNDSDDGGFFITFPDCIDQIELIFYDATDPGAGGTDGGSFSVNFEPTCDYPKNQTDLEPGTYTVIVTDNNGCQETIEVILTEADCIYDLALVKSLSTGQSPYVAPGDTVKFDITIINQDTSTAYNVLINDYIPIGYTFDGLLNPLWNIDSDTDGNPDITIAGPVSQGTPIIVPIALIVNSPFLETQNDLINIAEISSFESIDGNSSTDSTLVDIDSEPDTDPTNDAGGTPGGPDDDATDGDGTGVPNDSIAATDEDDQDPAFVTIFDLALTKMLSAGQSPYIAPGDTVSFDITVYNDGTVPAYNTLVNDYVPAGYTYDAAANAAWGDADADGNPDQTIAGPIAPGGTETLTIILTVNDPYTGTQDDLVNSAEISASDDDTDPNNTPPTDADSTPDNTPDNDAGGTPGGPDDDATDGDGTGVPNDSIAATDEDDQDPAFVAIFDLALTKSLSAGQTPFAAPGDTVSFDIEVFNQGTIDAYNTLVNDYAPAGYIFDAALNPAWSADSDGEGNPDITIAGPLAPGASELLTIQLIILDPFTANPQTDLTNIAEISAIDDDTDPNNTPPTDADSTPDTTPDNDAGGTPDGPDDDFVDGDGTGTPLDGIDTTDEDDSDPAYVSLFDLALTKTPSAGQSNYVAYGDTVTFDITVINQAGPAYNILVNDYVPAGYTFDAALNPAWADADTDGNPDQSVFELQSGADSTIVITLIINDASTISSAADLTNVAEISDADDDTDSTNNPPTDSDSTPDNIPDNDAGGTPDSPSDDAVDGDGTGAPGDSTAATDEDDSDPALFDVFDLALTKMLSPGQSPYIQQGQPVSYDITVYNQGTVDAVDVLVNDYVPTGMTYDAALNPTWGDTDADGNPDTTIAGPIATGTSTTITIILTVNDPFTGTPDELTNYAEITSADDDGDPNTPAPTDADSTPDNDPVNDAGGTPDGPEDDFVDGDGSGTPLDGSDITDEDDADPTTVEIFDLALQKRISVGQDQYVAPGDVVSFDITVSNQGFVDAYEVLVNDYIPSGYTYDPALNLGWGDDDADGNPDRTIAGPIIPGGTSTVQIQLIVNDPFITGPEGLVNYAEISAADDDQNPDNEPPLDFDSDWDNIPDNDAGGTPDGPDDDYIDGDASGTPLDSTDTTDEDDQDPAFISIFDLALTKSLSPGQSSIAAPGVPMSFDITIINQGSVDAYDILVNDYLSAGYTYDIALNPAWGDADADGNPDQTVAGPLAPGATATLTILLTVNDPFLGTAADLVNVAEISSADDDADPNTPAPEDVDSTPNNDPADDAGGEPGTPSDDATDGDGSGVPGDEDPLTDEDDQDPVFVDIFDVALTKSLAAGQSEYIAPGDTVNYEFTVYNQGTTLVYNILVNDFVPAGMTFDAALNTQWGDADVDGNPDRVIAGPLAPNGGSQTFLLSLIVNDPFTGTSDDLTNYAEIASSDNDDDTSTPAPTDIDSTPNNDPTDDAGGTPGGPDDDSVDGNGTGMPNDSTAATDEDDQDPALVNVFDLALTKSLSAGQDKYIAPGDTVSFDMTIYNQGTVDVYNVLVNDYVPAGMTFDAALNPDWSADSDADGNPDKVITGPIAPNTTEVITVQLIINNPFTGTSADLVNVGEIGAADDDTDPSNTPPTDYDSTPDTDPANDAGGTPDGPDDDFVDGDGTGAPLDGVDTTDEDDQDPAFVNIFDLALTKTLAAGQDVYITPGDVVTFDITVINQGTVDAYNTLVNDYVPAGMTYDPALNTAWGDADTDGNPDQTIAGPLAPGATMTLTIQLMINDPFVGTGDDLVNVAEVSASDDDNDPTNTPPTEADSTPDNTPDNDAGGEPGSPSDDVVDGDGTGVPGDENPTTDEDDSDPTFVSIFDLALAKTLSAGQDPYIAPGDVVSFDITVYNQGTVDAYDVLVNDYVPAGMSYDATMNPTWEDADADGNPDQTIAGPIAPNATEVLTIQLTINEPFAGTADDLVNVAEISAADDDGDSTTPPPADIDSTPDNDPTDDAGGTPGGPDDDFVDGDGTGAPGDSTDTTDEDDQDPSFVSIFDLALTKTLSAGQSQYIAPGDNVSFDIVVTNQGTVDAYNTLVNDYVAAGYTFDPALNAAWTDGDSDGNPDQTIAGPLAPDATMTLTIILTVNDPFTGSAADLVNLAEISSSDDDTDPANTPPTEADSTPDNTPDNDAGGEPDSPSDDVVDGDGSGIPGDEDPTTDEDDSDPAVASIFDLALTKSLSEGQSQYVSPGDVVTYNITVFNQGTVDAYDVLVNDYIPAGMTYDAALNTAWGDADADGNPDQTIAGPIAPGATMTLNITLTVNDPFDGNGDGLVNSAEISAADDDGDASTPAPLDADSTSDNIDGNDAGGTPSGPDDDAVNGDGTGMPGDSIAATDEDDQDPAVLSIFDLALTKSLSAGESPYLREGDTISYDITVSNQGTVDAVNVLVNEYIPAGLNFDFALNPIWGNADADTNPDQVIAGPIAPGASEVITIQLIVDNPFTGTQEDLINLAEISDADDDGDASTPAPPDTDSTPDNDPANDAGGTPNGPDDDFVDGDGSGTPQDGTAATDEDDQDPAFATIFDLSLVKTLSLGQDLYIAPGDVVSFDLTVINDGLVDAYNVLVNDYIPNGYTYDVALNPGWGDTDADGNPDRTIIGPIIPGGTVTSTIVLTVNDPFDASTMDLVNYGEISAADDDLDPNNEPPIDTDSTPDNNPTNDAGGTPGGPDDDSTSGDGSGTPLDGNELTDEDDQDPAAVAIFDLALTKSLSAGQSSSVTAGDEVSFEITVINQGTVDAYDVLVNDYVPSGYTFDIGLNTAWADSDLDGNPDQTVAGPIAPGGTETLTIILTVNNPFSGTVADLTNVAEISSADDDGDDTTPAPADVDSTPDNTPDNDAGGTPDGPEDDAVDGDGSGTPNDGNPATDEDDSDPTTVDIFDMALTKSLSPGQSQFVVPGDTVSFDITLYNQGTIDAYNTLVNDYVPAGYTFDAALNSQWGDSDLDGNPDRIIFGPLVPGTDFSFEIILIINEPFNGTADDLVNVAEISQSDDDGNPATTPPADIDSTPDNTPGNDAGGTPNGPDDDAIDGDSTGAPNDGVAATDEDDSDPATVVLGGFDLALIKTLSPGQSPYIAPGAEVSFDITVINQGAIDAYNILVNDYVPAGYTFDTALNAAWGDDDADGNPDQTIAGPIAPLGTETLTIILTVNNPFTGTADDLGNMAEISAADNDQDPNNDPPIDGDSTPDNDPTNDAGGTPNSPNDDFIDGDGTGTPEDEIAITDEDDADPATAIIFDLALTKTLSAGQSQYIAPGDDVSFDIIVTNQGTVDAYSVLVNEYIPMGYTFDAALNGAWGDDDADGNPDQTIAGPVAPGGTMTLTIVLTVNEPFTGTAADLMNVAEISAADDDTDPTNTPPTDADSVPNNDPTDDAGGEPGTPSDDAIDGDGSGAPGDEDPTTDEDDSDPAIASIFDLALTKSLSAGQSQYIGPGDDVSFDIIVSNQGTVDAYSVLINDYVPAGYTFDTALNAAWGDTDADGNPDQVIAGPLAAGTTMTLTIILTVNEPFIGTAADLVNVAEISAADDDTDPANTPPTDVDSNPNNDPTDDAGGEPNSPSDDAIDGDGSGTPGDEDPLTDEDDSDPTAVSIFDLALTKSVSTGQATNVAPDDTVSFDITVYNQGTVDAYNIEVNDYAPTGMVFNLALNPGWSDTDANGTPEFTIEGPLAPGTSQTVTVKLVVANPFDPTTMSTVNVAEIGAADDDNDPMTPPPTDADSTPNDDPTDDAGGTLNSPSDDAINGDGTGTPGDTDPTTDEDDSDPAEVTVNVFDLALMKSFTSYLDNDASEAISPGDDVRYTITVYNQGTIDATDVVVADHIPTGLMFMPFFNTDFSGTTPTVTATIPFIAAGGSESVMITSRINPDFGGFEIINNAEIMSADNELGMSDEDSTPGDNSTTPSEMDTDDNIDDDCACAPGSSDDPNDNDDYDPAVIEVQPNLPIELSYFKGTEEDCEVILSWGTESEINFSHFEVEKSTDGVTFTMIDRLDGLGGEGIATDYTYIDTQVSAIAYYRLKSVDLDGSFEYSEIVTIQADCATGISISDIFPNPTINDLMSVRFNSTFDHEDAKVIVTDMLGRQMMEIPIVVFDGSNLITVDPSRLPAATYVLTIQGNNWRSSAMRFVKLNE